MSAVSSKDDSLEALVGEVADEFIERLDRGEAPDVDEYLRRYPQIAAVLRQVLASLELMRMAPADPDEPEAPAEAYGVLGDFRILREAGRGGMAIVYEAEQISLRRRVALKVLPFAATMDPRQLQRFHNEARAAAGLHHTNIVPVYGVGCERGVHYLRHAVHRGPHAGRLDRPAARPLASPASDGKRTGRIRADGPTGGAADQRGAARRGVLPPGRRVGHPGGGGAGSRPCARRGPPRREAGEPAGGRDGPAVGHRLRPGADPERRAHDDDGRPGGHAALHVARAGAGQAHGDRPSHRRVFAGGDAVRVADPAAGLRRDRSAGLVAANRF